MFSISGETGRPIILAPERQNNEDTCTEAAFPTREDRPKYRGLRPRLLLFHNELAAHGLGTRSRNRKNLDIGSNGTACCRCR